MAEALKHPKIKEREKQQSTSSELLKVEFSECFAYLMSKDCDKDEINEPTARRRKNSKLRNTVRMNKSEKETRKLLS